MLPRTHAHAHTFTLYNTYKHVRLHPHAHLPVAVKGRGDRETKGAREREAAVGKIRHAKNLFLTTELAHNSFRGNFPRPLPWRLCSCCRHLFLPPVSPFILSLLSLLFFQTFLLVFRTLLPSLFSPFSLSHKCPHINQPYCVNTKMKKSKK